MKEARTRALLCDRTREWAALSLDAELSEFEQALMAAHLERCETCSRFAVDVRGFTAELRAAALEQPSEPIALPAPRARVPFRSVQVAAAAAVFLVAAGLGSVLGSGPSGNEPRQVASPLAGNLDAQLRVLRLESLKPQPLPRGKVLFVLQTAGA